MKAYYGDVVGSDGKHRYSDGSRFVSDTERQVEDAKRYLTRRLDRTTCRAG
ncbi:hypothetical protein [Amycolatopsis sp. lyj-108]|uniref:hypothetical protein n=1 Tax=Amycolatopsis sp. lyj-108 TaxID=2789286 RepID=UPI00397ADC56